MSPLSILERISKEQFLAVYNNHKPNLWTKFAFRYFSQSTIEKDIWIKEIVVIALISLFVMGFLMLVLKDSKSPKYVVFSFAGILVALGILMSGAAIMNNLRIRKIRKELGITKREYDFLQNIYLP